MTGITCIMAGRPTSGGALDTLTITTGGIGTAVNQDRLRGYSAPSGSNFGSCVPDTSAIYGGAAIFDFYWDEAGQYYLYIDGATNNGWTQVVIGGTKTLLRADAFYGFGQWAWNTTDTVTTQAFGSLGSVTTCVFT